MKVFTKQKTINEIKKYEVLENQYLAVSDRQSKINKIHCPGPIALVPFDGST